MATEEEANDGCSIFASGFISGSFFMFILCSIIGDCASSQDKMLREKEAVDRGYATFKTDGKLITFEWLEK